MSELFPMKYWWLSFCDPDRPAGKQFLGACVVKASNFVAAVANASTRGLNPGGEVRGLELPETLEIDPAQMERLLSRPEADALIPGRN